MKKIVRLTESDLIRIVKRVIMEGSPNPCKYFLTNLKKGTPITFDIQEICYDEKGVQKSKKDYTGGSFDCKTKRVTYPEGVNQGGAKEAFDTVYYKDNENPREEGWCGKQFT